MDIQVILERHEQQIRTLMCEVGALKEVQGEIRLMNESLITLANELKHTNEHLSRHEKKIDSLDAMPKQRLQQIVTTVISALVGGIISTIISLIFL